MTESAELSAGGSAKGASGSKPVELLEDAVDAEKGGGACPNPSIK